MATARTIGPPRISRTGRCAVTARKNVLTDPGEQDLTAHANFGLAQREGEAAGLATEQFTSQERFLNGAFAEMLKTSPALGQAIDVRQMQTLTHPSQMGRPFRALVQAR